MTHIFSLTNNKGGVLKTTTTVNLAYGIARVGRRVLVIDTDAQANTTYTLLGKMPDEGTLFDVLFNGARLADIIVGTQQPGLYLAPASIDLSAADVMLASAIGRERRLTRAIAPVASQFDYILLDTPPNLGIMTVNALLAATGVIVPVTLTTFGLTGIRILERTMGDLRANMDVELPIFGAVATLYERTVIGQELFQSLAAHFREKLFQSVIPRNVKVEESHNKIAILYDYAPASTGAIAYARLTQEVIERAEKR